MKQTMQCEACHGESFRRRLIDTSALYGKPHMSQVTRICEFCQGKGTVEVILAPSGKDRAANDREKNNLV